jgi:hypothetical protein
MHVSAPGGGEDSSSDSTSSGHVTANITVVDAIAVDEEMPVPKKDAIIVAIFELLAAGKLRICDEGGVPDGDRDIIKLEMGILADPNEAKQIVNKSNQKIATRIKYYGDKFLVSGGRKDRISPTWDTLQRNIKLYWRPPVGGKLVQGRMPKDGHRVEWNTDIDPSRAREYNRVRELVCISQSTNSSRGGSAEAASRKRARRDPDGGAATPDGPDTRDKPAGRTVSGESIQGVRGEPQPKNICVLNRMVASKVPYAMVGPISHGNPAVGILPSGT